MTLHAGATAFACAFVACASLGCTALVQHVGVLLFYEEATLPEEQIHRDIAYVEGPDAHDAKHRLDLFLPAPDTAPWPTLVFVHGGSWTYGDRALIAGGADPYGNIGRYFANQGIAVAVISYRLQPEVGWEDQIDDVARALRWVEANIAGYGGRADALFVSGHSAGAWLAGRVALDAERLGVAGIPAEHVCGAALVSGTAYDLGDAKTFELGADASWFEKRFDDGRPDWRERASLVPLIDEGDPPVLVLYASGEPEKLRHQSDLLTTHLAEAGVNHERVIVPGEDHERIVLTLSRGDRTSAPAILRLIRASPCIAR